MSSKKIVAKISSSLVEPYEHGQLRPLVQLVPHSWPLYQQAHGENILVWHSQLELERAHQREQQRLQPEGGIIRDISTDAQLERRESVYALCDGEPIPDARVRSPKERKKVSPDTRDTRDRLRWAIPSLWPWGVRTLQR